jgi:transposase
VSPKQHRAAVFITPASCCFLVPFQFKRELPTVDQSHSIAHTIKPNARITRVSMDQAKIRRCKKFTLHRVLQARERITEN